MEPPVLPPIDLPGAVLGFVGVHLALRTEGDDLVRAVEDATDTQQARRRAQLLARVLSIHHHAEDTVLWPTLIARHEGLVATTDQLEAEHDALDRALAALPDDLSQVSAVRRQLEEHLLAEERQVLPLWLVSFTRDEHDRFAASLRRSTPARHAGFMISWLLDRTPASATDMAWAQVPTPLRLAHRVWWKRRYKRSYGRRGPAPMPSLPLAA